MFALSQFSGPDYLRQNLEQAKSPEFQVLGCACRENNSQLAAFYLLGFFNPFIFIFSIYTVSDLGNSSNLIG